MSILIILPFRPHTGATLSKAQAETVSALVPAKAHNGQTFPVMPQGHTADRIGADAVRPWAETCCERLGGIPVSGIAFVMPDSAKRFAETLESSLKDWGDVTVLTIPAKAVEHLVAKVRTQAIADAVETSTTPDELMAALTKAGADKATVAQATARWMEGLSKRMAELTANQGA